MDIWSLGCIMAELLTKNTIFQGKSEIEQIDKIFSVLGSPNEKIWPGYKKLEGAQKASFYCIQSVVLRDSFFDKPLRHPVAQACRCHPFDC